MLDVLYTVRPFLNSLEESAPTVPASLLNKASDTVKDLVAGNFGEMVRSIILPILEDEKNEVRDREGKIKHLLEKFPKVRKRARDKVIKVPISAMNGIPLFPFLRDRKTFDVVVSFKTDNFERAAKSTGFSGDQVFGTARMVDDNGNWKPTVAVRVVKTVGTVKFFSETRIERKLEWPLSFFKKNIEDLLKLQANQEKDVLDTLEHELVHILQGASLGKFGFAKKALLKKTIDGYFGRANEYKPWILNTAQSIESRLAGDLSPEALSRAVKNTSQIDAFLTYLKQHSTPHFEQAIKDIVRQISVLRKRK